MILVNTGDIPHKRVVKSLGLVEGNTIRARNLGRDIVALLKNVVGGEIEEYTKLLAQSREQVLDRMIASAEELGANAIIGVRFSTSYIMQSAAEVLVYGTAVIVEDEKSILFPAEPIGWALSQQVLILFHLDPIFFKFLFSSC